jgi:predicted nucleic acid-binding protein
MLITDTGPLYAAAAKRDRNHQRCVDLLAAAERPIIVPALVVTEVCYLLGDRIGPHAELAFVRSIANGELTAEPVLESEWDRIAELTGKYADRPLSVVDASVIVLAERYRVREIASLDHRHFLAVRPAHVQELRLLP